MSATLETNAASAWRKRLREDDTTMQMDLKRPRYYYYRLESESSKASEEDTESVCSLQDRETDIVRDTTDTDSKSGNSDQDEYEVHYEEYEVASLSESDNSFSDSNSSSDGRYSEGMMLVAAAAAICDSSLDTWITDCEDSDNSSLDEASFGKTDFSKCIQCKSENDNPLYRYCEKCFQSCKQCKKRKTFKCFPLCIYCYKDRKKHFPPRPTKKKSKDMKKQQQKEPPPVKLESLRSYLKDLSQDSGIGSSQEWPALDLAKIVVPDEHLSPGTSQISTINETNDTADVAKEAPEDVKSPDAQQLVTGSSTGGEEGGKSPDSSNLTGAGVDVKVNRARKRPLSESSLSDFEIKPKQPKVDEWLDLGAEAPRAATSSDNSELCIMCNDAPKDAIFLHSKVAHQCCCYRCAKRTIKTIKRCPICNVTVNKVFRVIKS